jgi:sarcosine oxidase
MAAFDVIVVGGGGMGSAAAAHLASRGQRVLVLERFAAGHDQGSSHGLSRIIRLAYFEHPSYVPLLRRAFELWRALERRAGERLLEVTGALDVGAEGSRVFEGSLQSCALHGLPHEIWTGAQLSSRVPAWRLDSSLAAVFQPDGGFLRPERAVLAHLAAAVDGGAVLRVGERVLEWQADGGRVRVQTDEGVYEAGQLVLAAGSWMGHLVPDLAPLMQPERQVVGWFETSEPSLFTANRFPVFVLDAPAGVYYGFPEADVPGFKIGRYHHRGEAANPDGQARTCTAEDEAVLRAGVEHYFPGANGRLLRAETCLFTNTPDEHFIVDRHPGAPEVVVVSACSGHGFKFCSVIGEVVADLATRDATRHDIAAFRLSRFTAAE